MSRIDRRSILKAAVLASAVSWNRKQADAETLDHPPIIDTHQHLWDRSRFHLAWISPGTVLDRDFLPKDYAEATASLGVAGAVYMEVDVDAEQQTDEARYVSGLAASGKSITKAAVISGRPASAKFPAYLDQFVDDKSIKGVRQVLHASTTPAGYCLTGDFVRGIQELGMRGLSFDLCMRSPELKDGVKLVEKCPGTSFVLDHCGNPNVGEMPAKQWMDDIQALASQPNIVAKISGIIAGIDKTKPVKDQLAPFVDHVWNSFGPDRVVFGGDWPVCLLGGSYATWVETLREIAAVRSAADQRKLFHDNAVRTYRLSV
jgi:predicted TIM-barrel fold metal-dependent hydrolase